MESLYPSCRATCASLAAYSPGQRSVLKRSSWQAELSSPQLLNRAVGGRAAYSKPQADHRPATPAQRRNTENPYTGNSLACFLRGYSQTVYAAFPKFENNFSLP